MGDGLDSGERYKLRLKEQWDTICELRSRISELEADRRLSIWRCIHCECITIVDASVDHHNPGGECGCGSEWYPISRIIDLGKAMTIDQVAGEPLSGCWTRHGQIRKTIMLISGMLQKKINYYQAQEDRVSKKPRYDQDASDMFGQSHVVLSDFQEEVDELLEPDDV